MQRPFSGSQSSRIPRTRPQRPKTSLGFARRRPAPPSARLCGFDLRDYFRRHGSSAGLHVGVNGRPSGDPALRSYVEDCRLEALLREVHQEMVDEEEEEVGGSKVSLRERAPLCWESQVRRSEVTVRVPYSGEVNSGMTVTHSTADTAAESDRDKIIHTPSPPKLDAHHTKRSAANLEIEKKQPFVTPEGRCQCAEMEDEDTTDLRDIALKYPEIGLCVLDIEEEEEEKLQHHQKRGREREGGGGGHQKLAVSITMPSIHSSEDRGRKSVRKIYHPSTTTPQYIGIVRHCLSHYLN